MTTDTFFIAEAGVNHNGDLALAKQLIDVAAEAGADAIKFQTFKAEKLAASQLQTAAYQKRNADQDSQLAMLKQIELKFEWHRELVDYAKQKQLEFMSTAFDEESLAFLKQLSLKIYKIASGEIVNAPLLWATARQAEKVILSSGMSTLADIEHALAVLAYGFCHTEPPKSSEAVMRFYNTAEAQQQLKKRVTILHCTSQYPAPDQEINLNALHTIKHTFGLKIGYSDHSADSLVSVLAVACGARVIEKHFTLDKSLPGPDHAASLEPQELSALISSVRRTETVLGQAVKTVQPSEWDTRKVARQSLVAAKAISKGQVLTLADMTTQRIGTPVSVSPMLIWDRIGQLASRDYQKGEAIE